MPVATHPRRAGLRRRGVQTVLAILVLIVLLVPVGYLFAQLWASVGDSVSTRTGERAAVSYARPVNKLLAALVDAQYAAVTHAKAEPATVRAAVDDVTAVDRQSSDPLQVRQRWARLSSEINDALSQHAAGPDALRTFASPIALTQALLIQIADSAKLNYDPGPSSYQLTQVALRNLPDVVVDAGQLSALASVVGSEGKPTDPRFAVAEDRLAKAADDVSRQLRAGTDPGANYTVDLSLLGPLDEFTAATNDLSQAADAIQASGGGADRLSGANSVVKAKALALESAVLDAFDAQLGRDSDSDSGRRRALLLAGAVIVAAGGALLWLRAPWLAAEHPVPTDRPDQTEGRHSYPADHQQAKPDGLPRVPDLVDARDLLHRAGGPNGSAARSQEVTGSRWP